QETDDVLYSFEYAIRKCYIDKNKELMREPHRCGRHLNFNDCVLFSQSSKQYNEYVDDYPGWWLILTTN
ncbi:unnamed protein product, partial [Sphagnum jensenii]